MSVKRCSRKVSGADLPEVEGVGGAAVKRGILELLGHKHKLGKLEKERDRARILQEWEPSGAESGSAVATDGSSFSSCSPSVAHDVDEAMSTSLRKSPSVGGKMVGGALTWKVKWRSWRSKEVFSVAEGGSMDPERKVDHWSARTVLTQEESEKVQGTENERQGMEVDEVIPGMQPSSKQTDGGFILREVEEQQAARAEVQSSKRRVSDTCGLRRNARLRA